MSRRNCEIALLLLSLLLIGSCGASERKKKEGVAELKKKEATLSGLGILVSAGISQQEYSTRIGDALLAIGDLNQSMEETLPKFGVPEQNTTRAVYAHLSNSLAAYNSAKDFFGDTHKTDLDPFEGGGLFSEETYKDLLNRFPNLDYKSRAEADGWWNGYYWKSYMLQALWKVAGEEDTEAKRLISTIDQAK